MKRIRVAAAVVIVVSTMISIGAGCSDKSAPAATPRGACQGGVFYTDRLYGNPTGTRDPDATKFTLTVDGVQRELCLPDIGGTSGNGIGDPRSCRSALTCANLASDEAYAKTFTDVEALLKSNASSCRELLQPYVDDGTCEPSGDSPLSRLCGKAKATKCDSDGIPSSLHPYPCCAGFKCAYVDTHPYENGEPARPAVCTACTDGSCTTSDECCTGVCSSTTHTCRALAAGEPCTKDRDCSGYGYGGGCAYDRKCTGSSSSSSSSGSSGSKCKARTDPCTGDGECCGGLCCGDLKGCC